MSDFVLFCFFECLSWPGDVAQWVEDLPIMHGSPDIPVLNKTRHGCMAHACNLGACKVEAGESDTQGHPQLSVSLRLA